MFLASYIARLRRQGVISQLAAVFLGATFCTAIGLWIVADLIAGDMISFGILAVAYQLFTLTYCVVASLTFQPKRVVSPTHMQMVTIPIMFALVFEVAFWHGVRLANPTWESFAAIYGVMLAVMMFLVLVSAYFVLSPIVRYLVGLLGTKEDLLVTQFLVHTDHNRVLGEMFNADFQYAHGIKHQEEVRHNVWLFSTESDREQQMFVVVCPDSGKRNFTQIVVVSYELAGYGIVPTTRARAVHDLDAKEIRETFRKFKVEVVKLEKSKLMPALAVAYESSLACTESKILAIGKLSARHKAIIVLTMALLVTVASLGWLNKISTDVTESGLLFIGIAIVFEFFPAVAIRRGLKAF
jgi:hypothetical protein